MTKILKIEIEAEDRVEASDLLQQVSVGLKVSNYGCVRSGKRVVGSYSLQGKEQQKNGR